MAIADKPRYLTASQARDLVNAWRFQLHALGRKVPADPRAGLAAGRLDWAAAALLVGFTPEQIIGDRGLLLDETIRSASDFEVGRDDQPTVRVTYASGPPRRRPASTWGGSTDWLTPVDLPATELKIGPYTVTRLRDGRIEFDKPSRGPVYTDPPISWGPEPQPPQQLISPLVLGEKFVVEQADQAALRIALEGPVSSKAAEGLAIAWRKMLDAKMANIAELPRNNDGNSLTGLIRVSVGNLQRYGVQFARFGFDADDLFSIDWGTAGPIPVGIFTHSWRVGDLERADTSRLYLRPPADREPPPSAIWASSRPRWRQQPQIGPWSVAMRPSTGEAILRRSRDALGEGGEGKVEHDTIEVGAVEVGRLLELLSGGRAT